VRDRDLVHVRRLTQISNTRIMKGCELGLGLECRSEIPLSPHQAGVPSKPKARPPGPSRHSIGHGGSSL
jgi:hypothetical protein